MRVGRKWKEWYEDLINSRFERKPALICLERRSEKSEKVKGVRDISKKM